MPANTSIARNAWKNPFAARGPYVDSIGIRLFFEVNRCKQKLFGQWNLFSKLECLTLFIRLISILVQCESSFRLNILFFSREKLVLYIYEFLFT